MTTSFPSTSPLTAKVHGFTACDTPEYFFDYINEHIFPGLLPSSTKLSAEDCVSLYQAKGKGCGRC